MSRPSQRHPIAKPKKSEPLRFAHPFFTSTPPELRAASAGGFGQRMSQWVQTKLGPIVPPSREPVMNLEEIIGQAGVDEITALGTIRFHAVGDTGRTTGGNEEEAVAQDMATDYHPDGGGRNPAFFLHLGDVIYNQGKDNAYRGQFYRPYKPYPGKVIAIAGNHDGETFPGTDPVPLRAFLANFCAATASVPPIASGAGIFRETMTEPGVYWRLVAPFVDIIGLYSNIADGPGFLTGAGGDTSQTDWLATTLADVAKERAKGTRKALIVAVHHPPYSNGGHSGSPAVLSALDHACQSAGVMPDAVLSGHAHNYQRHTRRINFKGQPMEIPFLVAGCGGHNDLPVAEAFGQVIGDRTYEKSLRGYGYLLLSVTPDLLTIAMWQVPSTTNQPFDSVSVDLKTNRVVG